MRIPNTLPFLISLAVLAVPATASAAFQHVVAPGESLSSVAATDGLSVAQLAAANGLSPSAQLVAGTALAIPPQGGATPVAPGSTATSTSPSTDGDGDGDSDQSAPVAGAGPDTAAAPAASAGGGGYLVQPGDTLSAIAARYGVSVNQLAAANGLNPDGVLLYGTTISVTGGAASSPAPAPAASTGTTEAVSASVSSAGAQPTAETVSPSQVGSIAASEGVPPSLAEAIGYQESGFNNNEVSSTGATGVMQIEPGTWNYIGSNLAGPPPLSPGSASDNIRAGSLLLHSLLNATGGDQAMAAAAYYQGLASVQQHGLYPDTQRYVNDVMALQARFGGQ